MGAVEAAGLADEVGFLGFYSIQKLLSIRLT